ncbi:hypothetical protein SMACR_09337 [Sordaria macrospora]|nr:hypothetical protein SMACR_09337 [Sordaria macrospora]WPJ61303.1 hypothetical protein SMAC4_09337 [Sordaria macrospora]
MSSYQPERRSSFIDIDKVDCHDEWRHMGDKHDTRADVQMRGVAYLRDTKFNHKPKLEPGQCDRVSCSWNAAIFWCNDDDTAKELDSFVDIADAAQVVLDTCLLPEVDPKKIEYIYEMFGEIHMKNKWRVILDHDKC